MSDKCLKNDTMFIRSGSGFIPEGIRREGYRVETPYYEGGMILRILREVCFRCKLPFRSLWYNKRVRDFSGKSIIIYDPLITADYLRWLQKQGKWNLIFFYGNMVGRARHIQPDAIPEGIARWTYDSHDSRKYGMNLNTRMCYYASYCQEKREPEYDLLFVGRDKGRGEFLFQLEKEMHAAGMKTFFRVIGDTRLEKHKDKRYGAEMPYEQICALIARSRAILNVTLPNQEGLSVRDFESVANDVKLITTNPKIMEREIYNENNILVIDTVDTARIREFLEKPFVPYTKEMKEAFSLDKWIDEMTGKG